MVKKQNLKLVYGSVALVFSLASVGIAAPANAAEDRDSFPEFTFEAFESGELSILPSARNSGRGMTAMGAGIKLGKLEKGGSATVDASLVRKGALVAAGTDFVDLSWEPAHDGSSFTIYRDGKLIATTASSAYRDLSVAGGSTYSYQIKTIAAPGAEQVATIESTIRGFRVFVPRSQDLASEVERINLILASPPYDYTEIRYRTFLSDDYVPGPPHRL